MKPSDKLYDFTGKVILITGAAGAIGSEAARQFAAQGANVALMDINEEKVKHCSRYHKGDRLRVHRHQGRRHE